ncbi:MAG TPA: D-glycerate dehydrogenase [Chloroflexi bacterium]|nr:D-glycerate dehydrogenase [Chloroflexota bacterium]
MSKPKVFVTRKLPQPALDHLMDQTQAEIWPGELPPDRESLLRGMRGASGLLCLLTDLIDAEVMDAAGSGLKVISNCAVGFDNIDVDEASRRHILVGNTPGILTETTADFAFALLMAAARRVVEADRFVRQGRWKTWGLTLLLGQDVHGATLGLVGFGRIGKAMARRAQGFDMRVLFYDPKQAQDPHPEQYGARSATLEEVLRQSDFVSLHVPLTQETYHLIDEAALRLMKPTAILINTSRGAVVDHSALHTALLEGRIAGAALDVTEPEPLPGDSPLLSLTNVILAPHIASASQHTRVKMANMAVANLLAGLRGERLPYCVNPEVHQRDQDA